MNYQVAVFAILLTITTAITAISYHYLKQDWITFHEGEHFFYKHRFSSAITAYQKAIALGFKTPKIYERLGDASTAEGQFSEAINYYKDYLSLDPDNPRIHFSLARVLSYAGEFEESTQEYKMALTLKKKMEKQHEALSPAREHE